MTQPHPQVIECLTKYNINHRVMECDPDMADTAAFCDHYAISPEVTTNAIIVASKKEPIKYSCCLIISTCKLDVNKTVRKLMAVKKLSFATAEQTKALTGMEIGGVCPLGVPDIPIYIDEKILAVDEIVLGGGNRTTKILLAPEELKKLPKVEFIQGLGIAR